MVYIAPTEALGSVIKDLLTKKGFLVMTRSAGIALSGPGAPHEILVPAVEAAEAHEILAGELSAGALRPSP